MNIAFDLSEKHTVKLELVDVLGKTIELALAGTELNAGSYNYSIGTDAKLASGVYFSKLTIDGKVVIRKIVVE